MPKSYAMDSNSYRYRKGKRGLAEMILPEE